MGLETATFISELNSSWPLGTDSATEGDDHLRAIKAVLKATFPGANGAGFSQQILATEAELNNLHGLNANIMTLLRANAFPAGTVIAFYQAAPPPGWSLVPLTTSYMLVASASGGIYGGSDDPIHNDKVPSHTHSVTSGTLSVAGEHTHAMSQAAAVANVFGAGNIFGGAGNIDMAFMSMTAAGGHTHDITGMSISNNSSASNWEPRYLGVILCSKD